MTLKDPREIMAALRKKYLVRQDNLLDADRLFTINSVIKKLYHDLESEKIDKNTLIEFSSMIERCLKKEVDIYWKDGKLYIVPSSDNTGD
jgi:hypothetical protein